ncbi:TVP38/TMEM64 family protein [Paenibacillus sp. IB182496]|uniref:TVP38/TMEM64 family membrane protein n=1 Tax=Paenibacillus sabuli TaxID=2772509 RepID=A0A927GUZ6_9BACL|nr:VTT domain-containing protein [Paenibacillus sabuli]MBD2848222.1 TVP38/TMEM64 family protein [Paenibacillus sabuli]
MQEWIDQAIERLVASAGLDGYMLLLLTTPLSIVQGIVTFFPFATLMLLHVATFGVVEGLLVSWLLGTLASIVCFWLSRSLLQPWFMHRFGERLAKYDKWQRHMDHYGVWVVILLRSIPIVPSNIISIMAAISPLHWRAYLWSTTIGTFSQVWLFALLGSSLLDPDSDTFMIWAAYAGFCFLLLVLFLVRRARSQVKGQG